MKAPISGIARGYYAAIGGRSMGKTNFFNIHKVKGKTVKCATCGRFLASHQAIWYSPIDGMPREPYHSDCEKP